MPERQTKATQQRHERMLTELLKLPGNDRCADCPTKNPRWASYSLGVFLCVRCAGLHRKMGTHISRVKSISMDQWTPEQIDNIRQQGGNAKVNSVINPHPEQHPLPLADDDNERAMEKYVRLKWEKRAYMDQPVMPPPRPTAPQVSASRTEPPKRTSSAPALVHDPSTYESGVARLREMGFKDDERNRQVLRQTQGSLEAAVDILSRLPGAQRPLTNGIGLTDEQKMLRLNDLGYTDMAECRDALRRTGGNLEVAISLLQNARQPTAQPSKPAEPLSAFSTTSAFSTSQELAGRAQNSEERQAAKLSGTPMGKLLDVDDASRAVPNVSNPFNMPFQPQQQQQQQQLPQSSFTTTNPFGQSTPYAMMMPSTSATTTMQQSQLTGMPAASNGMAMFNVQPQQTGLQPPVSPMQPTMTGSSNPFSQMTSSSSSLTSTPATASSSPFQQHQQPQNDRYGLPQRSFTAPSFATSPFPSSPLQHHQQQQQPQPQQHQPFQQQQQHLQPQPTGMMMMNHGFTSGVPAQPTGYQNVFGNMPPTATAASTNPWANGSTGGTLF